jgi:hypothetical protein
VMYIFYEAPKQKVESCGSQTKILQISMVDADLSEDFDFHDFSAFRTSLTDSIGLCDC